MLVKGMKGQLYELEPNAISSGGEGSIYGIRFNPSKVIKIYHEGFATKDVEAKISYMVNNQPDTAVLNQIAWPVDMVFYQNGVFCGFVMPRLNITTVLSNVYVYPPKYNVSFKEKLILAQNICVVIHEIHKAGYVFGDFNPRNIGVNLDTGSVAFLDTDSYHIVIDRTGGKAYRCNVCASGYAAPELLGKCYDHISKHPEDANRAYEKAPLDTFTTETDNFALAIHIFKLLNNGYTPFNGVNDNNSTSVAAPGVGDTAVWRDNYCFKEGKKPLAAAVPPLDAHPSYIGDLFTRAFINGRKNPASRPNAMEWYKVLSKYEKEIHVCSRDTLHMYRNGLKSCPWCEADDRFLKALSHEKNNNGNSNSVPNQQNGSVAVQKHPVHITKPSSNSKANAANAAQVISFTYLKKREVIGSLINILGWAAFISSIIYVCLPMISKGTIQLDETDLNNINILKDVIYSIVATFILCFGSHLCKSTHRGLATNLCGIWGWIFSLTAATVYYFQLGYSGANASRTWRFFGILVGAYSLAMYIGIKGGTWLANTRSGRLFVKTGNRHKFTTFEMVLLILMIINCAACTPMFLNLSLFYEAVSKYDFVTFALWGVPVLLLLMFNSGKTFGTSTNAWFCAETATTFTALVLWLGHVGGAGAMIGWIVLAVVAVLAAVFITGATGTGVSVFTAFSLFVIFIVGAHIDLQVMGAGVSTVGVGARWWIAAPSIITIILATEISFKEVSGF